MVNLTRDSVPAPLHTLSEVLRCPRCGSRFDIDARLTCEQQHSYPLVRGVPRLVEAAWEADEAALLDQTSQAFGEQWTALGEAAGVTLEDLRLHLPAGWDLSVFSGRVLDAGCGMGRYTSLVGGLGCQAVGLDVSAAVEKAAQLWPDVPFVQADLVAPPFEPRSFDVVYSFGVLHHLPVPLRGWHACYELVRPGGLLLAWVYSEHGGVLRRGRRLLRRVTRRAPPLKRPIAALAAVAVWGGYLLPRRLLRRSAARRSKLAFYEDKSLAQLFVDCHDALAAPSEMYLTADDCRAWLRSLDASASGLEARSDGSGWILWARRAPV